MDPSFPAPPDPVEPKRSTQWVAVAIVAGALLVAVAVYAGLNDGGVEGGSSSTRGSSGTVVEDDTSSCLDVAALMALTQEATDDLDIAARSAGQFDMDGAATYLERAADHTDEMATMAAPVPSIASNLSDAAWELHSAADDSQTLGTIPQATEHLKAALGYIRTSTSIMNGLGPDERC